MRRTLALMACAVTMALLAWGVAAADTVTTTFEPPTFHPGSVNGQDGWHSAGPSDIPALPHGYDQEVVPVSGIPGFGTQSLRHSNGYNEPTGEFLFQTYSRPTAQPAGESQPNTEFVGDFSFISTIPAAQQPGLFMTISPDNSTGGRMSAVRLVDEVDGIRAIVFDTPDETGAFEAYDAGLYRRDQVHRVRFWMKFVPGPDNDIVRIFIDGTDIGQKLGVCFTTWENFYRRVQLVPVPVTNSIQFRASGGEVPALVGHGFLFDNVTTTTANGPGPAGCPDGGGVTPPDDIDVDKTTATRVARPGDLVTYRITVRNRGDAPAHRLRLCDRVPRALRFVRATRRLQRASGGRLCLTIRLLRPGHRRVFLATFRLRADVTADTVTNGAAAEVPVETAPQSPDAAGDPSPFPPAGQPRRRRVGRDSRTIGVLSEQATSCPAAVSPRAHAAC
ncbi:MAG TPA: DUF11 domain-containing protein [Solirubrobacteraceae bacterium]|nr:DUF11 domain-containing protein [Solirubrobacteraceae bacterium]